MATIKEQFGTANNVAINFSTNLNNLASTTIAGTATMTGATSDAVDNTTNVYMDALVFATFAYTSVTTATLTQAVYIYAYGWDAGASPVYTEGVTGSTASGVVLNNPTGMKLIGTVVMPTASKTYWAGPFSVAAAFGGVLPGKWGLAVINNTGQALGASGHSITYQGLYAQIV